MFGPKGQSHGGFLMPNISAWPNAAVVCRCRKCFRKGSDPAAVLFEFDGVRRDSAPSREARKELPAALEAALTAVVGQQT